MNEEYRECRHIKTSGGKCGSPAMRDKPYCYFHSKIKERAARAANPYPLALAIPALEDRGAIQLAIREIVTALADHRTDTKRAGVLLYALQIASSNIKDKEEIVSSYPVDETVQDEQGEELAPEGATYGPAREPSLSEMLMGEIRKRQLEAEEERRAEEESQLLSEEDFEEE